MNPNVIITCALTGAGATTEKNPNVPVTPQEIADSALKAAEAGAAVVHLHARDPKTGGISHDVNHFKEAVELIRKANDEVIINLTAGGGGDWAPSEEDPYKGRSDSDLQTPAERHEPIELLRPDISTLDCGSYNFSDMIYVSPTNWLREQAEMIQKSGAKPEMECFDLGQVRFAKQLIKEGLIDAPPMFQLCMGVPWGAEADTRSLLAMRDQLPEGVNWSAFGIGRMQIPMMVQSVLMGGNARVGLEDNIYLEKGVLATNEALVAKAKHIIEQLGTKVATPKEAREILGLREKNQ